MKVAKFGGSSLADAVQLKKVRDIIFADDARRYIVASAPGKGVNNNHKVTDLLAMCHQLSDHDLNFNEVYKIIEDVYKNIVDDLFLPRPLKQPTQSRFGAKIFLPMNLRGQELANLKLPMQSFVTF